MENSRELSQFLSGFLTPERLARIREVLSKRTNHLTVVLEDIFDPHNASAVLRTCDAMGIKTVRIIQNRHKFQLKEGVSMGSGKWLDLISFADTQSCFKSLRDSGFRIVAASPPGKTSVPLPEFTFNGKLALVMGSERDGLSEYARENSDTLLTIPMLGFAESFNLSVSAAIVLYSLRSAALPELSPTEFDQTEYRWICQSLRNPDELIKRFRSAQDLQAQDTQTNTAES